MDNGSLVAAISYLRGFTLLEARTEAERLNMCGGNNGHSGGIEAINTGLYKGELGNMDFTKLLNLLSLNVWVYPEVVKVEGLIPLDIPMDNIIVDIPRLNDKMGASKNSHSKAGSPRSVVPVGFGPSTVSRPCRLTRSSFVTPVTGGKLGWAMKRSRATRCTS
jgi:hypothetical protein